jgi:hypothetical protein
MGKFGTFLLWFLAIVGVASLAGYTAADVVRILLNAAGSLFRSFTSAGGMEAAGVAVLSLM